MGHTRPSIIATDRTPASDAANRLAALSGAEREGPPARGRQSVGLTPSGVRAFASERAVQLALCVLLPLALILAARDVFPPKYFFDSAHLHHLVHSSLQPAVFSSFVNLSWLVGIVTQSVVPDDWIDIGCGLVAGALFAYMMQICRVRMSALTAVVTVALAAVLYLYLTQLSKELLVLICLSLVCGGLQRGRWLFVICVLLAYALFARRYWILVIGLWGLMETGRLLGLRLVLRIALTGLGIVAILAVFHDQMGYSILSIREVINSQRNEELAVTMFPLMLPEQPTLVDEIKLYSASTVWYLFPGWLLKLGEPKYVLAFSLQLLMTGVVFIGIWRARRGAQVSGAHQSAVNLVMAVYAVLLLFEPDAGSFLKHQAPLIPLALGLAYGDV